jgi:GT2 family glycosyltransferase
MVGVAQQDDVGMVGAKLLFEDGTLQHGGHTYHGTISHALLGWPGAHPGPHRMLAVERECAGVTAAAALLRRDVFNGIGGMNTDFAINYNDVDLSLTLRAAGYRIVWTPHAAWFHFEQQTFEHPVDADEIFAIERRWGDAMRTDPYSNPNLAPGRTDWLELPLRSGAPPYERLGNGRISWG